MKTQNNYTKPVLAALGVYTLWGFTFLAAKIGQSYASPLVVLMYRFDTAALVMAIPWMLGKQKVKLRGKNVKGLISLGLCEPVLYFLGEQYGLKLSTSSFSGVMIAVIPIVTLILAAIFLRQKPTVAQWLFSALSIAGVIAIALINGGEGTVSFAGVALLCVAVVSGSAFSVISCRISDRFSVYERSLVMLAMGAVFFTLAAFVENIRTPQNLIAPLASADFIHSVLYLSLGASVAGYTLFNYAVANAPMANVATLCNLTTVISVVAGVVILGEPFSLPSLISLVVVLVGIIGVQKCSAKPAASDEAPAQQGGSSIQS